MIPEEISQNTVETPLERAVRLDSDPNKYDVRDEREADVVVGDIDEYVAETDPTSLLAAEEQLNAWQIPSDPSGVASPANSDGKLVSVLAAQSESEANIVAGLLQSSGIRATFGNGASHILGEVPSMVGSCWAELLVPEERADEARKVISDALHESSDTSEAVIARPGI